MNILNKTKALALAALLVTVPGCADLDVTNPNNPDQRRALATAGDVESLIAGSFHTWWRSVGQNNSSHFFMSAQSFQHSGWPANFGTVFYSNFPRVPVENNPANAYFSRVADIYGRSYSALAAVADGLRAIENSEAVQEELGEENVLRVRAYGKFVQGLAHASVAMVYDQGFQIDETFDAAAGAPDPLPYDQLMDAAMGYFDEAISLSEGADFEIPASWMSVSVPADELARIAHSMKARHMAAVARNPAEREAVNWQAVMNEIDAGITETFNIGITGMYDYSGWTTDVIGYWTFPAWQQLTYFIHGMADQSGDYQRWLAQATDPNGRIPNPNEDPVLIVTPDTRYAQGSTLSDQIANVGEHYGAPDVNSPDPALQWSVTGNSFQKPGRGTWRWSYYFDKRMWHDFFTDTWPEIPMVEMRLLEAEALMRTGSPGLAAEIINETRTAHGLNATDASGTNTSCVPKLPNGECGGLMEMLKWEKRLEAQYQGFMGIPWFFEGRGWGDTYAGTPIHLPIPADELQVLQMPVYTTGGCGQPGGAEGSVYNWPGEAGC